MSQTEVELIKTNAVKTADIADQQVTLAKLEHGTSSNDGKFLRANNGADPSFESITIPDSFVSGMIIMWSTTVASIPSGWVLCDGSNSTPDLRDRYIIGARQDDGGVAKTNITGSLLQTGGNSSVTSGSGNAPGTARNHPAGSPGELGVNNRGHGHPVTVIPPFFALVFIMKT